MKILNNYQAAQISKLAVLRLAEYTKKSGLKSFVLGISGGIDSAVVAVIGLKTRDYLLEQNYPVEIHYSFLDIQSDPNDLIRARELARKFKFELKEYDFTEWYISSPLLSLIPENHPRSKIAKGNIKCRLRMIALYHFAQITGGIYLDTDDLSEEYMGFWTKHGDEGDVKIIQHLTKDEVYDLGEYFTVPRSIINTAPGDGLGVSVNNLASDQLKLPYMTIDYIISRFIQNGFNPNGEYFQLESDRFIQLIKVVAVEVTKSPEEAILIEDSIKHVLKQSLKTAYKRKYGDNVAHLLPNRTTMNLPNLGTKEFNKLYLKAILK